MEKHIKYMLENKDKPDSSRIVIGYMDTKWALIYPSYQRIRLSTAEKLIKHLGLICIPAYMDSHGHETAASMYIFPSNRKLY